MERAPRLIEVGAREAERFTGVSMADQRKKRLRKILSPIPSGTRARFTIFDLAEIVVVRDFAKYGLATDLERLDIDVRRGAARFVAYWALTCSPELSDDARLKLLATYPVNSSIGEPAEEGIPRYLLVWRKKNGCYYCFTHALAPPAFVKGSFVAIPLDELGRELAENFGGPLAVVTGA